VLATVLGLVIIGGIRRIVHVAEAIVPTMATLYVIGALAVILVHLDQVGASFLAVFRDAFSGTAATGGFLGASFAYAFNRGVTRGLFSNEAGQGSAPIAHAAARAHEPVSEGMVSILEPFLDTIIICTLTGLVILASGVWTEKFETEFQSFDTEVVAGEFTESSPADQQKLFQHLGLNLGDDPVKPWSGTIDVVSGKMVTGGLTIIHNRSIAEDLQFHVDGQPYTGTVDVDNGTITTEVSLRGRSLIHSVDLTSKAFTRGAFGDYGQYIVTIGLVLFAFSTAVAWSYYGDRAMTYLFGVKSVMPYRAVYVLGFFLASVSDTSLIWLVSAITVAFMTLPNLLTILLLHREMNSTIDEYWQQFNAEHPEGV